MFWIFLLLQRTARAAIPGFFWKRTPCERCRSEYVYRMDRIGVGQNTSYGGDQMSAQQAADWAARGDLDRKLAAEVDPVPCPECGWYQQGMVQFVRNRLYPAPSSTTWVLCITFGALAMLAAFIAFAVISSENREAARRQAGAYGSRLSADQKRRVAEIDSSVDAQASIVSISIGLVGVGLVGFPMVRASMQRSKRTAYDPNQPGAPPHNLPSPAAYRIPEFERMMAEEQAAWQRAQQAAWQQQQAAAAAYGYYPQQQQQPYPAYPYPPQQPYPPQPPAVLPAARMPPVPPSFRR